MDSLNRKDQQQQLQGYIWEDSAELVSDGESEGEGGVEVTKEDGVAAAAAASR
jgi:hypothetical protein